MDQDGTRLSVESETGKSEPSPIPEGLEPALRELESYLDGEPRESLSRHVLVLASTWVLGDAGFELDRYYAEAKTFYDVTPEHDRVLSSFPDSMGYYMSLRLMMDEADRIEPDVAPRRSSMQRGPRSSCARAGSRPSIR